MYHNQLPFFKNGEVPSKYRRNKSYYIKIKYDWEKTDHIVTGFYNPKLLHKTDFQICLTVPKEASDSDLRSSLMHEVTHLVDDLIKECKSIKTSEYSNIQMKNNGIPKCIRIVLYLLWTNTEFNAW